MYLIVYASRLLVSAGEKESFSIGSAATFGALFECDGGNLKPEDFETSAGSHGTAP